MSEKRIVDDPNGLANIANRILDQEINALIGLKERLESQTLHLALDKILDCEGMVMVVGSGTSSSIARRLAHVLTCSGAPSIYLDPAQAHHGYSGIITQRDVLIAISRGGETDEVNFVLRIARKQKAGVISILENTNSTTAKLSDVVLNTPIAPENDAVGVIPLASTLVQAAVGDVLCAAVLASRGYEDQDFADLHPSGAVGKRLTSQTRVDHTLGQKESGISIQVKPALSPDSGDETLISPLLHDFDWATLRELKGLILDMDGVLWRGSNPMPGLAEFFKALKRHGIQYVLATNNPSERPEGFAEKAAQMGVEVNPKNVVTSTVATIRYLKTTYPLGSRVHVIGEAAMKDQIAEAGFILADEDVEAVIAALDRALTYETIKRGTLLIRAGAELIGTNPDAFYPTEEGLVPGSGMMVTALAASSDVTPVIMGKPESKVFDLAVERMGLDASQVASVGDRLDTDITGAQRMGMKTILVLSGVTSYEELQVSSIKPNWVFTGIEELGRCLDDNHPPIR